MPSTIEIYSVIFGLKYTDRQTETMFAKFTSCIKKIFIAKRGKCSTSKIAGREV
jgi:hypothetical protein